MFRSFHTLPHKANWAQKTNHKIAAYIFLFTVRFHLLPLPQLCHVLLRMQPEISQRRMERDRNCCE